MRNNYLLSLILAIFTATTATSCTLKGDNVKESAQASEESSETSVEQGVEQTPFDGKALDCDVDYLKEDSAQIAQWLAEAKALGEGADYVNFFSPKFVGLPYGGRTLDQKDREVLCINTKKVDCLTFVENVMALSLTSQNNDFTFEGFCKYLRTIRYIKDQPVCYESRNHYFFTWTESNIANGFFEEINLPADLTAKRRWTVNYMTKNPQLYAGIRNDKTGQAAKVIGEEERRLSSKEYVMIPEDKIPDDISERLREYIKDGDILMLLTQKPGLDTQHITLARWDSKDGKLHIRHASSLLKRVVNEQKTLYQYLKSQKSAIGIRILRLKK